MAFLRVLKSTDVLVGVLVVLVDLGVLEVVFGVFGEVLVVLGVLGEVLVNFGVLGEVGEVWKKVGELGFNFGGLVILGLFLEEIK